MVWLLVLLPVPVALAVTGAAARRGRAVAGALAGGGLAVTIAVGGWAAAAQPAASFDWTGPLGLSLDVTGLSRVMVVLVPAIALPVVVYASSYLAGDPGLGRLLGLMVAFVGAMELLVAAADFFTLLVAWELVGACSWALIGHQWRDDQPRRSALTAFLTTRVGDLGLYLAAAAAFAAGGSFRFVDLPRAGGELDVIAAGLLVAAAAKSAQLPFSPWLFAAMAGPTPVSALLHSATMVAAGAYALAKLAPELEATGWFGPAVAGLGLATALAGGVVAALQDDVKRALAASTSAQYGLILVAVGAGSTAAATSHLVTHATFKALLFLAAGVVIHAAGARGSRLPLTDSAPPRAAALAFGVGALALAAVPPLGGAASKEQVLAAAAHDNGAWAAGVVVAGVLSAFYAARLQLLTFGGLRDSSGADPVPRRQAAALSVLAVGSLVLGVLWLPGGREVIERAVGPFVAGEPWELVASLAAVAAGLAAGWWLHGRLRLLDVGLAPAARTAAADWLGLPTLARVAVSEPTLALARRLAAFDDRVIDAGVRGAAAVARRFSRLLSWWGERGVDGVVFGVASGALAMARGSRRTDERAVDAAVEGVAAGVGVGGRQSRRLQTGLAHHYYLLIGAGAVVAVLVAALGSL
jgi:NADH:ubiquinone oxidoreductase subunit 5 (subunit L)/multisubunit Na+/H+ antiporter MnhA subunit